MISLRCPRIVLTLPAFLLLAGCVTLKPASRSPGVQALLLEGVPTPEFGSQTCGAASLSAIMAYWGYDIAIDELDGELHKADNGGVLSLDLVLAARAHGFEAELLVGDRERIRASLEAGRPLILMLRILNAIGEKRDLYHYVIVDGFDPAGDLIRVQYGDGKARWVSADRLSHSWDDTGFATVVIQPAEEPGEATDPIRYAVALEQAGRLEEAEAIYGRLQASGSESALIWVNLGNVLLARGRAPQAEGAYRRALDLDPDMPDALNNLAWLLLETGSGLTEARELALRAASISGPDPYLTLETLGRIHLAAGQCGAATDVFRSALSTAPVASSERGWILYGLALSQRDCGRPEPAIATLEQALRESPDPELAEKAGAALDALDRP